MADEAMRNPEAYPLGTRLSERLNLEKVSWGAIWAGSMVTIGMEILFLSFGVFIDGFFGGSAAWATIWYLITMAIAFYTGAWCAARLSDIAARDVCILHGLTTWGVGTLATGILSAGVAWLAVNRVPLPMNRAVIWGNAEQWGGVVWGGVLLSLITAYFGAGSAMRGEASMAHREMPTSQIRHTS
jgi:hypothetical protein